MERHGVGGGDRRAHGVDEQELPVRPRRVERGPVPAVAERIMLPEKARPRRLREALEVVLAVRPLAQREGLEGHARHDTVACDMAPAIPPLPDTLPADPLPLAAAWLAEATRAVRNSTAMTLATVGGDGRPAARMVICRGFDPVKGAFVFYTDRDSDKGAELAARPWAPGRARGSCGGGLAARHRHAALRARAVRFRRLRRGRRRDRARERARRARARGRADGRAL